MDTVDLKTSPAAQEQVKRSILDVVEKQQSLGAVSTAFLSILITLTISSDHILPTAIAWTVLVFLASAYKAFLSCYRRYERFKATSLRTRGGLIVTSAASTGILWSMPMVFVDCDHPVELATVILIISGIISGSVNTYLGNMVCMAIIATLPIASIIAAMSIRMTPIPVTAIISIITFYAYIMSVSVKTARGSRELFTAKFENAELIENLESAKKDLQELANRDDLTGLPNRRLLAELFAQAADEAERNDARLAVLFIDMNDFKQINDRYGHEVGDKALVAAADIMRRTVRGADIVARLGGDEFVAVIRDIATPDDAALVSGKLSRALESPVEIEGSSINISASIGVSLFPDHSRALDTLLTLADAAMYLAKAKEAQGPTLHE
ncbi:GGDEF domain-containing protein [Fundidesulfovibrio agrisoli]|uniref:GGDEF domain-containing protein n=1 Tax=Fundidesulfovibrio agrisoli TaxID=2922717 RepID=UPI001FACE91C|nr:GGDEF domain-containing protein [Fundidesulfovibrio agrisoli]